MVWAFGFAAPWMLWGLLFAAAPLIIHWLFRRQYREVPWAAMQFLLAANERRTRRLQLDQWLLLLVRTAILLLGAAALAAPFWTSQAGAGTSIPTQRLLVVDTTFSLQARDDGHSRFEELRRRALALAEQSRPGDTWQLVRLAGSPHVVIAEPSPQVGPLIEELRSLEPSLETKSIEPVLESLPALIGDSRPGLHKEVYFFTDAQRTTWRPEDPAARQRYQTILRGLVARARLVWVDVGGNLLSNAAVTEIAFAQPFVITGEPLRATATIRRFGRGTDLRRTLNWRVDGKVVATQHVEFGTDDLATADLVLTTNSADELQIEAKLDPDALTADDQRFAVALVRDAIRVLLVDGRPSGKPFENATDCVRLALSPESSATQRGLKPMVITDGELLGTPLAGFDVVFLCDVARVGDRDAEVLRQYVAQGGALVIGLGPLVDAASYARSLGHDESDLLPARILEVVGDARRRDRAYSFQPEDFRHPIIQAFRGNPNTGFELTQTYAYRRLAPFAKSTVAVTFDTAEPAIVEAPYSRGRVVLIATALDRSWGNWPVWGHAFVPMMQDLVRYLVAFQSRDRQLQVGAPLVAPIPAAQSSGPLKIRRPDGRDETVASQMVSGLPAIRYDATTLAGHYGVEVATTPRESLWYAVNVETSESDLTPLTGAQLRGELLADQPIDLEVGEPESGPTAEVPTRVSNVAPRWLMGWVLLFLIAEPFLAWDRLAGVTIAAMLALLVLACWLWGVLGGVLALALAGFAWGWSGAGKAWVSPSSETRD